MNARLHPLPPVIPAATDPLRARRDARLLHIAPDTGALAALDHTGLEGVLEPGDLLVLNDAATLPALLPLADGGELRLLGHRVQGGWWAVELGAGSWRDDTDHRPAPRPRRLGEHIQLARGASARVVALHPRHRRVRAVSLPDEAHTIYASGQAVQYSYMDRDVPLHAAQTGFGGPPVAVEMPSASRLVSWRTVLALRGRGVGVARLTHAAGLSATGDPDLDAALPLPERFAIPTETLAAVERTRNAGGRVVAVGTSVVRALEGSHQLGGVRTGVTDLRLGPDSLLHRVDGLVTNVHLPGESHFELLQAFAPRDRLLSAARLSQGLGWLAHEFGDGWLILGERSEA